MPRHSSLVEVVAALLPIIDHFPTLKWKGLLTAEEFVEHLFPFIGDLVQNGTYAPPGASPSKAPIPFQPSQQQQSASVTSTTTSPQKNSSASPADRSRNNAGFIADVAMAKLFIGDLKASSPKPSSLSFQNSTTGVMKLFKRRRQDKRKQALEATTSVPFSSVEILRQFQPTCAVAVHKLRLLEAEAQDITNQLATGIRRESITQPLGALLFSSPSRASSDSRSSLSLQPSLTVSNEMMTSIDMTSLATNLDRTTGFDGARNQSRVSFEIPKDSSRITRKTTVARNSLSSPPSQKSEAQATTAADGDVSIWKHTNAVAVKKEYLLTEIVRIMTTPKGRRAGFGNAHFAAFAELRTFVELLLSSLFAAADVNEEERLSWSEFESFMTDSAIVYNNQLALRDIPIFVEDVAATVNGAVTFADITGMYSAISGGGGGGGSLASGVRLVVTVQHGVAFPVLKVFAPGCIDEKVRGAITLNTPSSVIKAAEYLEAQMCFVCCSDRAIHFYDFRFGGNYSQIAEFSLDVLLDSPTTLLWIPERGYFIVGGITGYMWKVTPPQWSFVQREWSVPLLSHCKRNTAVVAPIASGGSETVTSPTNPGGGSASGGVFRDAVHVIRRAYQPEMVFVAARSAVHVYDVDREVVHLTHSTAEGSIFHVFGVIFNKATQYLLCSGEALHILIFLSPNLADRSPPVKLEDLIAPHTGHIVGLESHPYAATIASMDSHGAIKVWDLNSMACTQNIFVPIPKAIDPSRLILKFFLQKLCVIVANRIMLFKVDDETIDCPPNCIATHPKGGSFFVSVNRDVIEFSSSDAKKLLHHQNMGDVEIVKVCFAGPSLIAVLNSLGAVTCYSVSSGKSICSVGRKVLKAEAVDLAFCPEFRRVVVPTAAPYVWFLSPQGSSQEQPFSVQLDKQDGAATCVSYGQCEKQPLYCVGTVENSVNIFAFFPPHFVRFRYRIPPPATANDDQDGSGEPSAVVALKLTMRALVVSDASGNIRVYRNGRWSLQLSVYLWELILSAGDDIGSITSEQRQEFLDQLPTTTSGSRGDGTSSGGRSIVFPRVLCIENYKEDSVLAFGDSFGRILFVDISSSLRLVHQWKAHATGGCNCIAVDKEIIVTSGDTADVFFWTSIGEYLGNVWGRQQDPPPSIPVDLPYPLWMADCNLIGSSMRLKKSHSRRSFQGTADNIVKALKLSKLTTASPRKLRGTTVEFAASINSVGGESSILLPGSSQRSPLAASSNCSSARRSRSASLSPSEGEISFLRPTTASDMDALEIRSPMDDSLSSATDFGPHHNHKGNFVIGPLDSHTTSSSDSQQRRVIKKDDDDDRSKSDSPSFIPVQTNLLPIAWKAKDVNQLDARFRAVLGNQRVLHCVSQALGQPDTIARSALHNRLQTHYSKSNTSGPTAPSSSLAGTHPSSVKPTNKRLTSQSKEKQHVKISLNVTSTTERSSSSRDVSPAQPRHRIYLGRSGNVVDLETRRSQSALDVER